MPALELSGLTLRRLDIDHGAAQLDLTLNLEEGADGLHGWFEYNTDLFDAATIARMAGHFQTLLAGIVAGPGHAYRPTPALLRCRAPPTAGGMERHRHSLPTGAVHPRPRRCPGGPYPGGLRPWLHPMDV